MAKNPRNYPDTMPSPESGRPMTRGEKLVSFKIGGRSFIYNQPGWWCSLTDTDDVEGQLVDDDNQIAEMARRTAKAIAQGETVFTPVVIRAIRERCGLTQREAGILFGTGAKSFEKYESGEIHPSGPTRRLLKLAKEHPELFTLGEHRGLAKNPQTAMSPAEGMQLVRETLRAAHLERIYEPLFAPPQP
jgi:HTH-type transcriptional regulator / antitoxin MqsA